MFITNNIIKIIMLFRIILCILLITICLYHLVDINKNIIIKTEEDKYNATMIVETYNIVKIMSVINNITYYSVNKELVNKYVINFSTNLLYLQNLNKSV